MAKNYIRFPASFLLTKEWLKPRKFSQAEALLYLLNEDETPSVRELAALWQWPKTSVQRFINNAVAQKFLGQFWDKSGTPSAMNISKLQGCVGQKWDKSGTNQEPYLIVNNNNPPDILSTTNVVSNISFPPKGSERSFSNFQNWISENAPRVAQMKEPFTEAQYIALRKDYDATFLCDLLLEMHNYTPLLTKNRSAYLTFRNWARRRKQWDNETKRTTNKAGNQPNPDDLRRAVAEGLARACSTQEWEG